MVFYPRKKMGRSSTGWQCPFRRHGFWKERGRTHTDKRRNLLVGRTILTVVKKGCKVLPEIQKWYLKKNTCLL